ncbi:MAG: outer membrane beta-barrel protein [Pseudomonadales bacterium]|nr:outer membrane beta-barrel protein [Pseudomonadales bacterium]
MQTKKSLLLSAALVFATSSGAALAHEAGSWLLRVGAHHIEPKSNNSDIVEVDADTMLTFNGTYMFTGNLGLEVLAALPFEHDIKLENGPKVASTKHLPPTVSVVWHFMPTAPIKPYAGVGVNYTLFFDEDTTGPLSDAKLSLDDSLGFAVVLGVDVELQGNWFLNADLRYMNIETDGKLRFEDETVDIGTVEIDPWIIGVNLGYRF